MNYKNFIKLLFIGLFSVFWGNFVLAETCPTDNGSGVGCTTNPYYCSGSCRPASQVPQCPDYTLGANNCSPLDPGCDVGCSESTGWGSCGICTKCQTGYLLCSATSGPSKKCAQKGAQIDTNCSGCTWSGGTSFTCTSCSSGYTLSGGACSIATVRLGSASVSGTDIRQGHATDSFVYINNVGTSIGTSTIPEATSLNVVGSSQFSSALLVGTPTADGHAATKSYVDDSLASSTGAIGFWTQTIGKTIETIGKLYTTDLAVNVGIGDDMPSNKLSVIGNITGSGSLRITGTATSSNYFASNLGVGSLPNGFWNKLVDLSGSGNSAYISRTGNIHAIMAASETGTPVGTGYDFNYSSRQMVLGTITKDPINFIILGSSKMFLSNNGKLGIGTTNPAVKLTLQQSSSEYALPGSTATWDIAMGIAASTTKISGMDFKNFNSAGQVRLMARNDADDYVVLNAMGTNAAANFFGQNGNQLLLFGVGKRLAIGTNTSHPLIFGSANAERMRISENGNVGIGTTTPEAKLDVNGSLAVRGPVSLTDSLYIGQGSRLLMVDNYGNVSVTSTIPGGGGDYVSKTGDTMTGGLTFENIPGPGAAIDLNGFNIVGVNKITVTTIDPLYDIGGTKYSTYAPSVVGGVKEEYIGRGQISNCGVDDCSWRLDFSKVAVGSDLWVWRKIVEFNPKTIDVVMTAYGRPALLSYEIKGNQLIFYADRPTEFSYRLIGPRFDWRKWPTLAEDQSEKASLTIE